MMKNNKMRENLTLEFTSQSSDKQLGDFAKIQTYCKKLHGMYEFDGSMRVIESLCLHHHISEADFESACSVFESGKRIDTVHVKWA